MPNGTPRLMEEASHARIRHIQISNLMKEVTGTIRCSMSFVMKILIRLFFKSNGHHLPVRTSLFGKVMRKVNLQLKAANSRVGNVSYRIVLCL